MSIYHFYSDYEPSDQTTKARQKVARMTWSTQLWTEIPIKDEALPRIWDEEGRRYPYVLDLFDSACVGKHPEDCMVYTNADICVFSNCALVCVSALQETDAFYSYRIDLNNPFHVPVPDDVVLRGTGYAGSDLYGFRVRWWQQNRKDFPDMLIGQEAWDPVLRCLMNISNPGKQTNLPNTHYHQRHGSWWEDPNNRHRLKGQKHNLKLAFNWLKAHGVNPASHGIQY